MISGCMCVSVLCVGRVTVYSWGSFGSSCSTPKAQSTQSIGTFPGKVSKGKEEGGGEMHVLL